MSSEKMAEKTFRPMLTYADGVYRLSSLIAWLNDDYGDGIIFRKFYDGNISEE